MRKFFPVLAVVLALGGCAQLQIAGQALSLAEKSATNPVTKDDLAKFEVASNGVVKILLAYRRACEAGSVDTHCKGNIEAVQVYTRQIPPYIQQLRGFVKNNDQINAYVVYNQLVTLFTNAKATAANLGINLGA